MFELDLVAALQLQILHPDPVFNFELGSVKPFTYSPCFLVLLVEVCRLTLQAVHEAQCVTANGCIELSSASLINIF